MNGRGSRGDLKPIFTTGWTDAGNKKADVAMHSKVIRHVGLLGNAPTSLGRFAIY